MSAKKLVRVSNTDSFTDVRKELSPQGSLWNWLNARVVYFFGEMDLFLYF